MTNDEYMIQIRKINKLLKTQNKLEHDIYVQLKNDLVSKYEEESIKDCNHEIVQDIGYFKTQGKDISVAFRENADFRLVECSNCGSQIYLVKTNNDAWDTTINNHKIRFSSKQKCKNV